jgi:hypothetical protein
MKLAQLNHVNQVFGAQKSGTLHCLQPASSPFLDASGSESDSVKLPLGDGWDGWDGWHGLHHIQHVWAGYWVRGTQNGKLWKDPPFFMGKSLDITGSLYGKIHHAIN